MNLLQTPYDGTEIRLAPVACSPFAPFALTGTPVPCAWPEQPGSTPWDGFALPRRQLSVTGLPSLAPALPTQRQGIDVRRPNALA